MPLPVPQRGSSPPPTSTPPPLAAPFDQLIRLPSHNCCRDCVWKWISSYGPRDWVLQLDPRATAILILKIAYCSIYEYVCYIRSCEIAVYIGEIFQQKLSSLLHSQKSSWEEINDRQTDPPPSPPLPSKTSNSLSLRTIDYKTRALRQLSQWNRSSLYLPLNLWVLWNRSLSMFYLASFPHSVTVVWSHHAMQFNALNLASLARACLTVR